MRLPVEQPNLDTQAVKVEKDDDNDDDNDEEDDDDDRFGDTALTSTYTIIDMQSLTTAAEYPAGISHSSSSDPPSAWLTAPTEGDKDWMTAPAMPSDENVCMWDSITAFKIRVRKLSLFYTS